MNVPFPRLRPPRLEDAQAVCDLVVACDVEDFGEPDFVLDDVLEMWSEFDMERNVWVAEDEGGRIVGYAFLEVDGGDKLSSYGYVLPAARGAGVGAMLLRAIEGRALAVRASLARPLRLQNVIPSGNEAAEALLRSRGFEPARYFKRMRLNMQEAPGVPELPQGIAVETFVPGRDEPAAYDAYVESFADHWDFHPPSFEAWKEKTKRPGFDPRWWFLARDREPREAGVAGDDRVAGVAGDERVAGFAFGRMHEDTLYIDQIGVRRGYRGQGLGLALLRAAFAASFAAGQRAVSLGVDAANPSGAYRLYELAGMKPVFEVTVCEKRLP